MEQARRARIRADPEFQHATEADVLSIAYKELVHAYAPGVSFLDVGCMWRVHGALSFLAEERGATSVTGFDVMDPTPEFEKAHQARESKVRFVGGNLFDRALAERAGIHDVVWCTGVLYHEPHPLALVQDLQAAAGKILILGTKSIPEIPGFPQAAVYFPRIPKAGAATWAQLWGEGIPPPYGTYPSWNVGAEWWWGLTRSAVEAMVTTDSNWRIKEVVQVPWNGASDDLFVIAERVSR